MIGHREDHGVDFSEELDVVRSHVAKVDAPKLCRHLVTTLFLSSENRSSYKSHDFGRGVEVGQEEYSTHQIEHNFSE